jgi:hypothetical protein
LRTAIAGGIRFAGGIDFAIFRQQGARFGRGKYIEQNLAKRHPTATCFAFFPVCAISPLIPRPCLFRSTRVWFCDQAGTHNPK